MAPNTTVQKMILIHVHVIQQQRRYFFKINEISDLRHIIFQILSNLFQYPTELKKTFSQTSLLVIIFFIYPPFSLRNELVLPLNIIQLRINATL